MKPRVSPWIAASVLAGLCALLVGMSLMVGAERLDVSRAWHEWRSGVSLAESPTLSILVEQRMPRTLASLIAGAGLALSGCAFQALLRNPLATPYILGVSSAASLGAFTATILLQYMGVSYAFAGFSGVQVMAFVFALAEVSIIYAMAAAQGRISPGVLLLAGVTIGNLANAGILMLRYLAKPDQLVSMDRWLMGGVNVLGYRPVLTLFLGVTPCLIVLLAQASKLDQLGFGVELAESRGVNVRKLQAVTFVIGSLMTAVIVSEVGPIGFVGLLVPHAVRTFTGSRHRLLMPLTLVAGGAFLCFCDILARKLLTGETPIGIITSLFGGPFFLYMLLRKRLSDWDM